MENVLQVRRLDSANLHLQWNIVVCCCGVVVHRRKLLWHRSSKQVCQSIARSICELRSVRWRDWTEQRLWEQRLCGKLLESPHTPSEPRDFRSSAQEVFPVCAVTRAQRKEAPARSDAAPVLQLTPLHRLPAMVSRNDSKWAKEQRADGSLLWLWDQLFPSTMLMKYHRAALITMGS